ncbi:kelch repeat-containing protein [Subtercola sp. RTI3]|uniref:kelch repeat-containing protein n=1 Tax=Subtercola sp. RTI3 TaxID=3048639 RepID=UPI002B23EBDC|nr:kelch repeat-containing protein [Subtercola sp. RTI3]MEA9985982.1 kelch repeat-containing protein [Subtercola sp. RTI3]
MRGFAALRLPAFLVIVALVTALTTPFSASASSPTSMDAAPTSPVTTVTPVGTTSTTSNRVTAAAPLILITPVQRALLVSAQASPNFSEYCSGVLPSNGTVDCGYQPQAGKEYTFRMVHGMTGIQFVAMGAAGFQPDGSGYQPINCQAVYNPSSQPAVSYPACYFSGAGQRLEGTIANDADHVLTIDVGIRGGVYAPTSSVPEGKTMIVSAHGTSVLIPRYAGGEGMARGNVSGGGGGATAITADRADPVIDFHTFPYKVTPGFLGTPIVVAAGGGGAASWDGSRLGGVSPDGGSTGTDPTTGGSGGSALGGSLFSFDGGGGGGNPGGSSGNISGGHNGKSSSSFPAATHPCFETPANCVNSFAGGSVFLTYLRGPSAITPVPHGTLFAIKQQTFAVQVSDGGTVTAEDGTVETMLDRVVVCDSSPVSASGSASCIVPKEKMTGGEHTLTYFFSGSAGFADSFRTQTITVAPDPNTVSIATAAYTDGTPGSQFEATVSPNADGFVDGKLSITTDPPAPAGFSASCQPAGPATPYATPGTSFTLKCPATLPPGHYTVAAHFDPTPIVDTATPSVTRANSASFTPDESTVPSAGVTSFTADAYVASVSLKVNPTTSTFGTPTTATVLITPPAGALVAPSGTVHVGRADGGSSANAQCDALVNPGGQPADAATATCTFTPDGGQHDYTATSPANNSYAAVSSSAVQVDTTALAPTLSLSILDSTGAAVVNPVAGQSFALSPTVTGAGATVISQGVVTFYDGLGSTTPIGTIDLSANPRVTSLAVTPAAGPHTYLMSYHDPSGSYSDGNAPASTLNVKPLSSSMWTSATSNSSGATAAGVPMIVTTRLSVPATDALSSPITLAPAPVSPCSRTESTHGSSRTITVVCVYTVVPGSTPSFTASYSDALVGAVGTTENSTRVANSPTTITVVGSGAPFGTSPTVTATVSPTVTATTVSGTVTFIEGATTLCSTATSAVAAGATTISCILPAGLLHAGNHAITASFVPDATSFTLTSTAATSTSVTVTAVPVSVSLTTTQSATQLVISVRAAVDGGTALSRVPVGSVKFTDNASSCHTVALDAGALASCAIPLPAAGAISTLSAAFIGTSTDFIAGGTPSASTQYQLPSSGPCSTGFGDLWTAAQLAGSHSFTVDTGGLGSISITIPGGLGVCDRAGTLSAKADVSLFNASVTATAMTISVNQASGLCLETGSLALPSAWRSGALSVTQAICFPLTATGGVTAPTSGSLALASGAHADLPLVSIPGVSGHASLRVDFGTVCPGSAVGTPTPCDAADQTPAYTVVAAVTAAGSAPGATLVATVGRDGSAHGALTTSAVRMLGTAVIFTGTVDRSAAGTTTATLAATMTAGATPTASLSIKPGAIVTVTGMTGTTPAFALAGTASIAAGTSSAVDVAVTGSFVSTDSYSLALDSSSPPPAWSPADGLTITPVLHGTLARAGGATTFAVSAAGAAGHSLVTWAAQGGVTVTINTISVGGDPKKIDSRCPYTVGAIAAISGSLTVGGLTVPASGCLSLADHGWHVEATSTGTSINGVDLSLLSLDAWHAGGGTTAVFGTATAKVAVGSKSGTAVVTINVSDSILVIGGQFDATSLGLPSTNSYLAYASAATTGWLTGVPSIGLAGVVDLPAGLSVFGSMVLPSGTATVLKSAHFALPSNSTVTFSVQIPKGSDTSLAFAAALNAPSAFPLLTLPGGTVLNSASVSYADKTFGLTADGTVKGQDATVSPVHLAVAISGDGSFTGTGTVTNLGLLGRTTTLTGVVSRTAAGVFAANLSAPISGTIALGDATASGVTLSVGTAGLGASGTLAVASATVPFTAQFASMTSYSLTVSTTIDEWSPATGVTVNAAISGALTHTADGYSYDFAAAPTPGNTSLVSLNPAGGVTLALNTFELGNGARQPAGCSVSAVGDSWLVAASSVSLSAGAVNASATGNACFDLTHPSFGFTTQIPGSAFSGVNGRVTMSGITVLIARVDGAFTAQASSRLNIVMPSGAAFSLIAQLTFGADGFAVGGTSDLSSVLGGSAHNAYIYYANSAIDVQTGDPTLGTLTLQPGVTAGLDFSLGANVSSAIHTLGLNVGAGTMVAATAALNFADPTVVLTVDLKFGPHNVFSNSDGTYLREDTMALAMMLSQTQPSFAFITTATLHLPKTASGSTPSDVAMVGGISIGTQLTAFMTVNNWSDAFGISGLTINRFTLQGGITLTGLPLPSLAVAATVSQLPSPIAGIVGYQQGAPITVALGLGETSLLLDLSIGTRGSSSPALKPFALFGKADLVTANFAELYISPTGATIGQAVYPAGYGLAFQGAVFGIPIDVDAAINPNAGTFHSLVSLGAVSLGSLHIGHTTLLIDAAPSRFNMAFAGSISLSPTTLDLGLVNITVAASAALTITVGTSGFSAMADLSASIQLGAYLPHSVCAKWGVVPWPCDWYWETTHSYGATISGIGFSINASGIGINIPGTGHSITLPLPSGLADSVRRTVGSDYSSAAATPQQPAHLASLVTQNERTSSPLPAAQPVIHLATAISANPLPEPTPVPTAADTPPVGPAWQTAGSLGAARLFGATAKLRDGRVLAAGGSDGKSSVLSSAEIYDPTTGGWTGTTPLTDARANAATAVLPDGRVLVAGGTNSTGEIASAEIFDPATATWSNAGHLSSARQGSTATLLPDGTVLVAGGLVGKTPVSSVDIYSPASGTWSAGAPLLVARASPTATALTDGTVLVAGGLGQSGAVATAEIFHPASGTWSPTGSMLNPRFYASAIKLADGRVLESGSAPEAETYDPATGSWSAAGIQSTSTVLSSMVPLADGTILVAGGISDTSALSDVASFDPQTNEWTTLMSLPSGRGAMIAAPIQGGVLIAGGANDTGAAADTYVYDTHANPVPATAYEATAKPTANGTSTSASGSPAWIWIGIAALVLLAIVVSAMIFIRRRRSKTV